MARGVNKVILIGNLGQDPETRYLPSGQAVTNFSIATSEQWKDKQTGEQKERTEWHNIETWGRLAEVCAEYLRKGTQCYVEGMLRTDSWEDEQGNKKYKTKIRANTVQFFGSGSQQSRARTMNDSHDQDGMPPHSRSQQDDFDDDIPF